MSSQDRTGSRRQRIAKITGVSLVGALFLSACSPEAKMGWLPTEKGVTDSGDRIIDLWVNSWIVLLIVGIITWGLMLWCIVAYRRRKNDTGFPRQLSYNLPIEIFYVVVPLFMVLTFFFFTERDQAAITARVDDPDVIVDVRAKQWSWDFNYLKEETYSTGQQAQLDGTPGALKTTPILYLPVNKTVELRLNSRDVIHSFWVPAFVQKIDMIPGKTNYMTITPGRIGTYDGKCAELCGEYHSEMLFRVKVVSQQDFEAQMQKLRDKGNTGHLGEDYDRKPYSTETK